MDKIVTQINDCAQYLSSIQKRLAQIAASVEGPYLYDLNELEGDVIQWAKDRKIIPNATLESQALKAVSEMGELADAVIKGKTEENVLFDAIGDVVVCLINLCALKGVSLGFCLQGAYNEIKDRRGTLLPNGCFVKEEAK